MVRSFKGTLPKKNILSQKWSHWSLKLKKKHRGFKKNIFGNWQKLQILLFLVPATMSPLHVWSKVCMPIFHVRNKVCIAPIHVPSKFVNFAPHMEGSRDAKTYQRANNIGVKNSILGKIFAKFYAVMSRKWVLSQIPAFWPTLLAILCFYVEFFVSLCYFMALFSLFFVFWAFYAVMSRIKICQNFRTFSGKMILAPNLLV